MEPARFPPNRILAAALTLGLAACGGGNESSPPPGRGTPPSLADPPPVPPRGTDGDPRPRVPGPRPYGLQKRPVPSGLKLPLDRGNPAGVKLVRAFPNLKFNQPLFLTHPGDGTDRIFVVEKPGRILVFPNSDAATSAKVFLDISAKVNPYGERGLLGLAFAPDYARSGEFYVYYSTAGVHHSIVARYRVLATDPDKADPKSEQIILKLRQPYANHNGGMIAFGPDGMLYIGLGDGGSGGDPQDNGQNLKAFLGKILRIDPKGTATYRIPPDNPFAGNTKGYLPEIYSYGMRNPWRFSFDRLTGELWCADVGQNAIEEIDLIVKGGNYGWRLFEGTRKYGGSRFKAPSPPIPPIFEYDHTVGRSIIGGYVYRGAKVQNLRGAYVYGDYVAGTIWALVYDRKLNKVVSNTKIGAIPSIGSFGEDRDGELYAVSLRGQIYRFADSTSPGAKIPPKLSQTGLFASLAPLKPAPGLLEYEVSAPLWSDSAEKRRFLALPANTKIAFARRGPWTFPVGTILVKHFEIRTSAAATAKLETRVLVHEKQGWAGYTYVWNQAQTDADLSLSPKTVRLAVFDPRSGSRRTQNWTFPGMSQCLQCHNAAAGFVLGVRTAQLNRDHDFGGVTDNQIRAWNHVGMFAGEVPHPMWLDRLAPLAATQVPLDRRVRSYLDANCAQCHRPGGPAPGSMDMRFETPLLAMNLFGVPPHEDLGVPGARRIAPGAKEKSVLWLRIGLTGKDRMPPLGTNVVDEVARRLIGAWIDGLK